MKKGFCLMVALLAGSMTAQAALILESEPNDSLGGAQNVESAFSGGLNANIENSGLSGWEWASISATGNGTFDYFSFDAQAGQSFIFDIDFGDALGGSIDTELGLWSAAGGLLSQIDDCRYNQNVFVVCDSNLDPGSISIWDPIVQWTFAAAGSYVIGVGEYDSFDVGGGFFGSTPNTGDTYTLQISRDMASSSPAAAPVPEPGTLALIGLGLLGIGFCRRTRRS